MDRKPPTLIKSLSLVDLRPSSPLGLQESQTTKSLLHHVPEAGHLLAVLPPADPHFTISVMRFNLPMLFAKNPSAIAPVSRDASAGETLNIQLRHELKRFVRTPNGRGLLALDDDDGIGVWYKQKLGRPSKAAKTSKALVGKGWWKATSEVRQAAIFAKGRAIVLYPRQDDRPVITLQHVNERDSMPSETVELPDFCPKADDEIQMLLAVSDIDDGSAGESRHTQRALAFAASQFGDAWVWRIETPVRLPAVESRVGREAMPEVKISLVSRYTLPIDAGEHAVDRPHLVLPVDPMGWHETVIDWDNNIARQDLILTISRTGLLEFWTPRLGDLREQSVGRDHVVANHQTDPSINFEHWIKTRSVHTGRSNILFARCSSRRKTAISEWHAFRGVALRFAVCAASGDRHEMTIWDSNVSEFSTGLELTHVFE